MTCYPEDFRAAFRTKLAIVKLTRQDDLNCSADLIIFTRRC